MNDNNEDMSKWSLLKLTDFIRNYGGELPEDFDKQMLLEIIAASRERINQMNLNQLIDSYRDYALICNALKDTQKDIPKLYNQIISNLFQKMNNVNLNNAFNSVQTVGHDLEKFLSRLLIVGETSSGKSEFLNTLLRLSLLPSALRKTTTNICDVLYGETGKLEVLDKASNNQNTGWRTLADGLAKEPDPPAALARVLNDPSIKSSSTLRLYWPSSLLENGIILTDSPGMNDKSDRDALVKDYASSAIGVILIINAGQGLTKVIREFVEACINDHKMNPRRFFVVLTHLDLAKSETDKNEVLEQVITDVGAALGPTWNQSQFCIANLQSTMNAIKSRVYSDDLENLLAKLVNFMGESLREKLLSIFHILDGSNATMMNAVVEFDTNLKLPLEDRKRRANALKETSTRFHQQKSDVQKVVQRVLQEEGKNMLSSISRFITNIEATLIDDLEPYVLRDRGSENTEWYYQDVWGEIDERFKKHIQKEFESQFYNLINVIDKRTTTKIKEMIQTVEVTSKNSEIKLNAPHPKLSTSNNYWVRENIVIGTSGVIGAAASLIPMSQAVGTGAAMGTTFGPIGTVVGGFLGGLTCVTVSLFTSVVVGSMGSEMIAWSRDSILKKPFAFKRHLIQYYLSVQSKKDLNSKISYHLTQNANMVVQHILDILQSKFDQTEEISRESAEIIKTESSIALCSQIIPKLREISSKLLEATWTITFPSTIHTGSLKIDKLIGNGSFGEVYQATLLTDGNVNVEVAAKKFTNLIDPHRKRQLYQESEALQYFNHKNIVKFYGICEKAGPDNKRDYYAVLEKMDGTLADYNPAQELLQQTFIDIAEAIHIMHQSQYVHRDICLENILYRSKNTFEVKVSDFGSAKPYFKTTGTITGHKDFQSPELIRGEAVLPATDIYSFGVVMYKLLHPNRTVSQPEAMIASISDTVLPHWKHLIANCLQRDATKRPNSHEVLLYLKGVTIEKPSFASKKIKILTLDGGGSRGIIMARILQEIEELSGKKISELFDLIGGTSTGGILALALCYTDKRFSAKECIQLYKDLASKVFANKNYLKLFLDSAQYDASILESFMQSYFSQNRLNPDNSIPKVFVTTKRGSGLSAYLLRNYESDKQSVCFYDGCTGWLAREAARATSAAPFYFPQFAKDEGYRDGGVGFNNPSQVALDEAFVLTSATPGNSVAVLVSLGCGDQPVISADGIPGLIKLLVNQITNSMLVHERTARQASQQGFPYFRFNPTLEKPSELDVSTVSELDELLELTEKYLRMPDIANKMKELVTLLKK